VKFTWVQFSVKFILLYVSGIFALGLGVALFARASLGVAPWDTAILNLQRLLLSRDITITIGQSSLIHTAILLLTVLILGKKWQSLLAIIPMIAISAAIDLWDLILLPAIFPSPLSLWLRIVFFIVATVIMTWGLATIIISGFPPNVYDDFHLTIIRVFHMRSFTLARWIIEFLGVSVGLIYALIQGDGFGSITPLSFLLALAFGSLINFFVSYYRRLNLLNRHL
jgi:uncharacterized membrane protein YczE